MITHPSPADTATFTVVLILALWAIQVPFHRPTTAPRSPRSGRRWRRSAHGR